MDSRDAMRGGGRVGGRHHGDDGKSGTDLMREEVRGGARSARRAGAQRGVAARGLVRGMRAQRRGPLGREDGGRENGGREGSSASHGERAEWRRG